MPEIQSAYLMEDLFRVFMVMVPGSLVLFGTGAVLLAYSKAYLADRAISKTSTRSSPTSGLLPKHVMCVSFSVMVYSVITICDTAGRFDTHLTWRFYCYILANPVMLYGLYCILRFERLRYEHAES